MDGGVELIARGQDHHRGSLEVEMSRSSASINDRTIGHASASQRCMERRPCLIIFPSIRPTVTF